MEFSLSSWSSHWIVVQLSAWSIGICTALFWILIGRLTDMKHFHEKSRYIYIKEFSMTGQLKIFEGPKLIISILSDRLSKNLVEGLKLFVQSWPKTLLKQRRKDPFIEKWLKKSVGQTDYNCFISKLTSNWHSALEGQSRSIYELLLSFY